MNHPKNPMISPEEIVLNTKYSITINPEDSYQFWSEPMKGERIKKSTNHMRHIMRQNPNYHLDLQMETSSLGRLHWHGTILFKDDNNLLEFFLTFIHDFLTKHVIEIDIITDKEISKKYKNWEAYCTKQKRFNFPRLETSEVCKTKMVNPNRIYKDITEY